MTKTKGTLKLSLGILGAATVLYYWGWIGEKRASRAMELPYFEIGHDYWRESPNQVVEEAFYIDTLFRSFGIRRQGYLGKYGESIGLSLTLLVDVQPLAHCLIWNPDIMNERIESVTTGLEEPGRIELTRVVLSHPSKGNLLFCYWYMGLGGRASNFLFKQIQCLKRRLLNTSARFLMVRVATPVGEGGEEEAFETAERFIRDAYPSLHRYYEKVKE